MIEHTQRGDTQLRVDGGHARCGLAPPSSGCKDEAHQGRSGPRSSTTRCDVRAKQTWAIDASPMRGRHHR